MSKGMSQPYRNNIYSQLEIGQCLMSNFSSNSNYEKRGKRLSIIIRTLTKPSTALTFFIEAR
jgi:hypothetical protein